MSTPSIPKTQTAIILRQYGEPTAMEVDKAYKVPSLEEVTPTKVLIKNVFAGINFIDTNVRRGKYPSQLPIIPGMEGAGTVVAAGSEVQQLFPMGSKVGYMGMGLQSYAEYALIEADKCVPILDSNVSFEDICGAMMQGMTAHYLTSADGTYEVKKDDHVLIHAGAGGMGLLLTQVCKLKGAKVTTTVSTQQKAQKSKAAGADNVVLYANQDGTPTDAWVEEARKTTPNGQGFNVIYDSVGKTTFAHSLDLIAKRGMVALYGSASGPPDPIQPLDLVKNSTKITRPTLFHHVENAITLRHRANEALTWIASGKVKFDYVKYPLDQAAKAHEDLQGRSTTGKLLLQI
ncbi:NAD(P)-binding protein [Meira miltonrushii]|uniref:NAD(P)-binding protein n=1 Tax=Meira miltonrushii TaxID=1280837 RepID=A0A316V2R3_9BASI|nr:NAD(P)-binding protein [Meira miltonrushii]PWN31544.1 NAD(P)-binding protein [Meira miltonrushii]